MKTKLLSKLRKEARKKIYVYYKNGEVRYINGYNNDRYFCDRKSYKDSKMDHIYSEEYLIKTLDIERRLWILGKIKHKRKPHIKPLNL